MGTGDPFAGLKALQRASSATAPSAALHSRATSRDGSDRGDWIAKGLGGELCANRYGEYVKVSRWFTDLVEAPVDANMFRLLWPEAADAATDPQQWLLLDTETTGLAGGTGTYAFLIGVAWWEGSGLQVEQFFLRDLNEEWPVLLVLAERLEQRPVLVTFNGKAFDWPLLQTRYRMMRSIAVPELRAHLDFLHPARTLWRPRLGSVRLAELERHVLGWERRDDVPSEMIPRLYLDFLRGGPADPLLPVLLHNQMDLRGLAALSRKVLSLLEEPDGNLALDVYGVSRIYECRGEWRRARELYESAIASRLPCDADRAARSSLARLAKRDGDYSVALDHWQKALSGSKEGLHAYEQMAIYYEHRAREPRRALDLTNQALAELGRAYRLGTVTSVRYLQFKAAFEYRLARLERKTRVPQLCSLPWRA